MNMRNVILKNKKSLYECQDLIFSGIPVKFAGAGAQNVKLRWSLTGIGQNKKVGIDQTMWVPYEQLPNDFINKVKEVCQVTEEANIQPVDISFFKG